MTDRTHAPTQTSPSTVEVVAMLGDSILDVVHVEPKTRPRPRWSLYALRAAAVVFFGLAGFAFLSGIGVAAENERALHAWTNVERRPFREFRPKRSSAVHDWLALTALGGGFLALVIALIRAREPLPRSTFTIGTAPSADLCIKDAPFPRMALLVERGDEIAVCVAGKVRAELRQYGRVHSIEALAALGVTRPSAHHPDGREVPLPEDGTVYVHVGAVAFAIRKVAAGRAKLATPALIFERRLLGFFAVSGAAHLAVVALLGLIPPDPHGLLLDLGSREARWTRVISRPNDRPIAEPESGTGGTREGSSGGGVVGGLGKAGDRTARAEQKMSIRRRSRSPQLAYSDAIGRARRAGFVDLLRTPSHSLIELTQMADFSSGDGLFDIHGNLDGDDYGPGTGVFGNSHRGYDPTGGTVRVGDYPTIGPFGPGFADPGFGEPGVSVPRRPRTPGTGFTANQPRVVGDMDREIIRRYIRRQRQRLRYCYERQLAVEPNLAGTVNATFLIDGHGAVIASRASGLHSEPVEACVARVIKSIRFPRPSGGGSVRVTYPFHFRISG
ncbi:MAG: AgmX/PglI C-terminal domain-containing protein [Proteobacteria bacterium]|nr:AgmX/PglI C-terminal domain-containing protein [Pseudomonadota bacterium]